MFKPAVSLFVFFAISAIVQGTSFKRIDIEHGQIKNPTRFLEDSSLKKYTLSTGYTHNAAVKVEFGGDFNTEHNIDATSSTDMLVFLFTSVSGVVGSRSEFKDFKCKEPWCKVTSEYATTNKFTSPFFRATSGSLVDISTLKVSSSDGGQPWKLKTPAFFAEYVSSSLENKDYFDYSFSSANGGRAFGWIGLGVDGEAAKNFDGSEPIFSVAMTGLGKGSIIFGKDSSYIKSSSSAITLKTDGNWAMKSKTMTLGPEISNNEYVADVNFDMNYEYIGIPSDYLFNSNSLQTEMTNKLKMTYDSTQNAYTFKGDLKTLPNLDIGLPDEKVLSIPPQVYMKAVEGTPELYVNVIKTLTQVDTKKYIVLGLPVLQNYYAVFNKPKDGEPQVTLYPSFVASSSGSSFMLIVIIAVVVVLVLAVIILKGKKSSGVNVVTKPSSGLELR